MRQSETRTFVGVDGSRWEIEVSDDPGIELVRVSGNNRSLLLGVDDGPDGPVYPTKALLPPEEWEQHKAMLRELSAE